MIFMDKLAIAIATFDKSSVLRNLQPNPWMPKRTFAAIAGYAVAVDDTYLWGGLCHACTRSLLGFLLMTKAPAGGKRIGPLG